MEPRLARALRLAGWQPSTVKVVALKGGITNENYRVEAGGESFVLRLQGRDTERLGIDRARESECARIAAVLGVGPQRVFTHEAQGVALSRFIKGKAVTAESARAPAALKRIVAALKRVHDGPRFPGMFDPFETVRRYHALAVAGKVGMPAEALPALELARRLERELKPAPRLGSCHNDLLASNLIDDGATIRILDWEYAAAGDPFFDLGNFAINQGLAPAGRKRLLLEYLGAASPGDLARLEKFCVVSDLREGFWGLAQAAISRLKFDFLGYAEDHLKRALKAWNGKRK